MISRNIRQGDHVESGTFVDQGEDERRKGLLGGEMSGHFFFCRPLFWL